jgi:hypothetical protein
MQSGGLAASTAACGVIPQAQNTGSSSGLTSMRSPANGRSRSAMPIAAGSPMCTGAPWARGKREVIRAARSAFAGVSGRIDTAIGPRNGPDGSVSMLVRYIETFLPSAT